MCEIAKYPELYSNARGVIRKAGIRADIPGYELLIRAAVQYKVEGDIKDLSFKKTVLVPYNKEIKSSDNESQIMQWMLEAAKAAGIDEQGKGKTYVKNVIKKMAEAI